MKVLQYNIPEEERQRIKERFLSLQRPDDLQYLLNVPYRQLTYFAFVLPETERYTEFHLVKKSGGVRVIHAPQYGLKRIQRRINRVLQCVYDPKPSAHGFLPAVEGDSRSVASNASKHIKKRFVLNVDLKDFFPSINFGRVYGLLQAQPYSLPKDIATLLAALSIHRNALPQGAPTSPILTNMICSKMDQQLQRLARENKCTYTRYADDITFSTTLRQFPDGLAYLNEKGQAHVGDKLLSVIIENGFEVNTAKVRLQSSDFRQEVTGLTTNEKVNVDRRYVRQLRAMLHSWRRDGLTAAARRHFSERKKPFSALKDPGKTYINVLRGKLAYLKMIKGSRDPVYIKYASIFSALSGFPLPTRHGDRDD